VLVALAASVCMYEVTEAARRNQCSVKVETECGKSGSVWRDPAGCTALYGGYQNNQQNLAVLVKDHLQDSFKFLLMGTRFNRDDNNRVGLHSKLMGYSGEMWNDAIKLIKYMTKRGGNVNAIFQLENTTKFKLSDVQNNDFNGEVDALAISLDMYKTQADEVSRAIRQTMNKKHLPTTGEAPFFDPSIYKFLEEEYLQGYTEKIRDIAGYLNILGKIAKNDQTKRMGLHLFDQSLKA